MGENIEDLLNFLYYDLKSPLAYTSRRNIYKEAKKLRPNTRKKEVDKWFENQLAPTLPKSVRYKFKRNKTVVKGVGEQFQSDLCDVGNIKKFNDNFTFLLTCIDCFSRFAWVVPLKNKTGLEIVKALEGIFSEKICKRLQTDKGKEYLNKHVKELLAKYNVELWTTNSEVKASLVERFNRTMKNRMYKYFTANNTKRYVDILPLLVEGYNNTTHSSIGMPPSKVRKSDQIYIRQKLYGVKNKVKLQKYKYQVGDYVRISKAKRMFKKGYLSTWTQ
jgi:transposase InsO family protein